MTSEKPSVISIGYGRHFFDNSNGERRRMQLCAKECNSLHMIIFTLKKDGLEYQESQEGFHLCPTNSSTRLAMVFDAYRIVKKIIKSNNKKYIVTTQDPFGAGLVGLFLQKKLGVHLTVQEHADAFSGSFWKRESIKNQLLYILGKYILRQADTVRVVSDRIVEAVKKIGVKANITKLPVAIDVDKFTQIECQKTDRFFGEDTFQFLSVARFVPQKNLSLMIESFSEAYKKNDRIRLLLVGEGPDKDLIEEEIVKNFPTQNLSATPIKIIGWSENIPCLMRQSDAYLLTSNYEGWGRVLIEAMISSLPVVTTDVGCVGEVVLDRQHGLVVPVEDKDSLVNAIATIAGDKDLHNKIKSNLKNIKTQDIVGTDLNNYGVNWVRSLS
ncbi:glycosyltransferase family 4 protein [Candidatus Nomurabacteria bacterium]|nr:glycosyltransferase family 4 protein [Candidatus Nomurabacteria bacterium]